MDNNEKNEKAKDSFSDFWQKTSDISKKTVKGAKAFIEQAQKNIHEAQARKYTPITAKEFKSKGFKIPSIIEIVEDNANREFITGEGAIGWIENHEGVDVLHMYCDYVKKCNLDFVPVPQRDNVYCEDNFDSNKYINSNQVFGKATEEKLAELEHIAYTLGAKSCSVEIMETDRNVNTKAKTANSAVDINISTQFKADKTQSGKTVSYFQGNDSPSRPNLKWFAHDDNIKRLIEMRCTDRNSIKSKIMELKGSSSATMSKKIACAIDSVLNTKGSFSMEKQVIKEHSKTLVFEIEF